MDPKEFRRLHEEHLKAMIEIARRYGLPEEKVRKMLQLMMIHMLLNSRHAPDISSVAERNNYLSRFTGLSERKIEALYADYVDARRKHPDEWACLFLSRDIGRRLH